MVGKLSSTPSSWPQPDFPAAPGLQLASLCSVSPSWTSPVLGAHTLPQRSLDFEQIPSLNTHFPL